MELWSSLYSLEELYLRRCVLSGGCPLPVNLATSPVGACGSPSPSELDLPDHLNSGSMCLCAC